MSSKGPSVRAHSHSGWHHKLASIVFIFFCFEVGAFLLLFPWLELWDHNFFASLTPGWEHFWASPYVRGAVSGLGLINIWISFSELFRLRRFSKREGSSEGAIK